MSDLEHTALIEALKRIADLETRVAKLEAVNQAELEQHAAEQQQDFSFGRSDDSEAS